MPTPRHRAPRPRSILLSILLVVLGSTVLTVASPGGPPTAAAAVPVAKSACSRIDPNLVNGLCLQYVASGRTAYTWIGSYRADNGKVFFCIDYLYDSRIVARAPVVGTDRLQNQLGRSIGDAEVAALNYLISTWAPHGSTGSNQRDAAIALIIREVMSDGIRPDGTVVYPRHLRVGGTVAAPTGGLPGPVLELARTMWHQASRYRGPGRLVLTGRGSGMLELGDSRQYRVSVESATRHPIPGLTVRFSCSGPIRCPRPVITKTEPVAVTVTPTDLGRAVIKARAWAPDGDGKLLRMTTWRTHGGSTASDHGVQRGWIAQRNSTVAQDSVQARIVKGTPTVTTRTSAAVASPRTELADEVTVSGLPSGSEQQVTATLFGPLPSAPDGDSCTDEVKAGQVTFVVDHNGTVTTPTLQVDQPGYYVWTESMPGDDLTNPVTTPCGIVEETTVVKQPPVTPRPPTVHTVASASHLLVGDPVHDLVTVADLADGVSVEVGWTLLGPLAPRGGSCAGLDWAGAPALASGSFTADHSGSYTTRPTRVRVPGCLTFTEHLPATPAGPAVDTTPGETSETFLVTRPVVPVVPEIPSGPARGGR